MDYVTLDEETRNRLYLFREQYRDARLTDSDAEVLAELIRIAEESGELDDCRC